MRNASETLPPITKTSAIVLRGGLNVDWQANSVLHKPTHKHPIQGACIMTIYTQTVTLTVFSKQPINENVLIDSLKDDMHKLGAVADVEVVQKSSLTDA